jgi:hypothetical protein
MCVISCFTNIITKKFETIIKMMGGETFLESKITIKEYRIEKSGISYKLMNSFTIDHSQLTISIASHNNQYLLHCLLFWDCHQGRRGFR